MQPDKPAGPDSHEFWNDRLSAYLDGELKGGDRARLEAHLAECAACAVALAELRQVMERARTLEDTPPASDLWPAIEAQLTPRTARAPRVRERGTVVEGPGWWGRRFELGLPQLAAAAALLVLFSAGAMWLVVRGPVGSGPAPVRSGPAVATVRPEAGTPATGTPAGSVDAAGASLDFGNPRYDAAVAELEQALAEGRGKLDPHTLAVVEQNLKIIDSAIADARRAVAADPANTWLRSHLAATMKKKVDLLRSATLIASAQG